MVGVNFNQKITFNSKKDFQKFHNNIASVDRKELNELIIKASKENGNHSKIRNEIMMDVVK